MRHRQAGRHLGRDTAHRKALYRNLVTDLLRYERITTTEAKAKEIRPMAERIITLGKRGDVHARRQAMRVIYDKHVVERLFDDIAPRMAGRPGGYLRITALEPRKGDGALMAAIELIDYLDPGGSVVGAAPPRAASTATTTVATAPPPVAAEPEDETAAEEDVAPVDEVEEATAEAPEAAESADEVEAEADTGAMADDETEEAPAAEVEEATEAEAESPDAEEDEKDGAS